MNAETFSRMMNDQKVLRVLDSLLWADAEVNRRRDQLETVSRTDDEVVYRKSYDIVLGEYQRSVELQARTWGVDVQFVIALMNEREITKA